jgi:hypothetical protein
MMESSDAGRKEGKNERRKETAERGREEARRGRGWVGMV